MKPNHDWILIFSVQIVEKPLLYEIVTFRSGDETCSSRQWAFFSALEYLLTDLRAPVTSSMALPVTNVTWKRREKRFWWFNFYHGQINLQNQKKKKNCFEQMKRIHNVFMRTVIVKGSSNYQITASLNPVSLSFFTRLRW